MVTVEFAVGKSEGFTSVVINTADEVKCIVFKCTAVNYKFIVSRSACITVIVYVNSL